MIYLKLFLVFLEIGAVSFGGGYGMIPLIREKVLKNDWLTEEGFLSFVAVSESTPGPLAVNMATFVGASQGGFFGALCATFGVVLPAFLVILLIAAVLGNLLRFAGVQATLSGMRPVIVGLILATAFTMILSVIFGIQSVGETEGTDWRAGAIFIILVLANLPSLLRKKRTLSPILCILLSAALGIAFYSF